MNAIKQIGVIEYGNSAKLFELSPTNILEGYTVSKIYYKNNVPASMINKNYPNATIVKDEHAIIGDSLIDMVIVSSPSSDEMNIVGEALKANKPTRVV